MLLGDWCEPIVLVDLGFERIDSIAEDQYFLWRKLIGCCQTLVFPRIKTFRRRKHGIFRQYRWMCIWCNPANIRLIAKCLPSGCSCQVARAENCRRFRSSLVRKICLKFFKNRKLEVVDTTQTMTEPIASDALNQNLFIGRKLVDAQIGSAVE